MEQNHLSDYARGVYKRRRAALPAFLLVVVTMAVSALRETPRFTQLLIEKDAAAVTALDRTFQQGSGHHGDLLLAPARGRVVNVSILRGAEAPTAPIAPDVPTETTIAFVASLVLAIGLTFGFEFLNDLIKTPHELKSVLPIRFLGVVPSLEHGKNTQVDPLLSNGVPREFSEAFSTVCSNVLLSSATDGTRSLVITSADPGEGKSLVASNLAIALAQGGQRVLLIDADMRRPRVHEIFGGDLEPGLSNVLAGDCTTNEAIHESAVAGLSLIHAGLIPPNPAELLGRRYTDFMASLAPHFDWVVLDTPPVIVVPDSSIAASGGSGVVFVVGADQTSRQSARAALARLEASGARMLGTVLNRADVLCVRRT